jgi:competence protein ComEA
MSTRNSSRPEANDTVHTPRGIHFACYLLLAAMVLWAGFQRRSRPLRLEETIAVERDRLSRVERRIDPNTAGWAELACLPGIGEVLARRIVSCRTQHPAGPAPGVGQRPTFATIEDLDAVKGIGPKTLVRIRPYLKFPTTAPRR